MTKKNLPLNTKPIYDAVEAAVTEEPAAGKRKPYKARKVYTEEEAREAANEMRTSGRKGVKLQRINLACTPENYEFIQIMSKVRGQKLSEFINDIITTAREKNADIYRQAIAFREALKGE